MKLQEIVDTSFAVFSKIKPENREKQIEAINYIAFLANVNNIDISDWNIFDIFGSRGNKLVIEKNKINKLFFEKLNSTQITNPHFIDPVMASNMDKAVKQLFIDRIKILKYDLGLRQSKKADYTARIFELEKQIVSDIQAIKGLENSDDVLKKIIDEITKVPLDGFWSIHGEKDGVVKFFTNSDVILKNENVEINFGKFSVNFDIKQMQLSIGGYENNITSRLNSGFIHPHVDSVSSISLQKNYFHGGDICWGSSRDYVSNLMTNFSIKETMALIANLLVDYNPENPFIQLETFHAALVVKKIIQDKIFDPNSKETAINKLEKICNILVNENVDFYTCIHISDNFSGDFYDFLDRNQHEGANIYQNLLKNKI